MALKKKLTKAEYDKLSDGMKGEYIADGEGFKLDLTDDEDTGPLKRALEREKADKNTSKARVAELEAQLEELSTNDARKTGDIAKLEKQWQKKLEDATTAANAKIERLTGHTTKSLVDNVATGIASKISRSPALLLPHIKARLQANFEGDEPQTVVLDKDGKPSKMTVEELSQEFVANKDFSAIIIASQASGSAGNANKGGSASNNNPAFKTNADQPADLSKLSPRDLANSIKESKATT